MNTGTPEHSPLDDSFALAGAWLAARIEEDPARLGLGDGTPSFERTIVHERPDQFAAIFFNSATGVRHIVEVQLGTADRVQVDRALRHLEQEQGRLPLIPHRGAIAAERIPEDVLAAARYGEPALEVVELRVEPSGELATVHGHVVRSQPADPEQPEPGTAPAGR
ncbi:hypothetical protein [Sinomonas soli]